jgi:hypothetical protein
MILAQLVVFVGIAGNHTEVVDHQLAPVFEKAGVTELAIPTGDLGVIARHSEASREVVKRLHVDGVIGGALIAAGGKTSFRLVIYDGEGNLKSLGETPLVKKKLSKDDLEVLGMNLEDEIGGLTKHHKPDPAPMPAPIVAEKPAPVRVAAFTPPPASKISEAIPAKPRSVAEDDSDAPPGLGASAPAPKHEAPAAAPAPKREAEHPTEAPAPDTADAVSLDDVESLTSGGGGNETPTPAATSAAQTLHLHAGVGFGVAGRVFSPGPATVAPYSSTPVGAVSFVAGVQPTPRTALEVAAERTLTMSTPLADGMATTTISRWQVAGSYALVHGAIDISPTVGIGHRSFSIDSTDTSRSPDGDYSYVVLGTTVSKSLGTKWALRGLVAVEPVFAGVEPTEMAFGDATRYAVDVGAAIEMRPFEHVFARAGFDYQRFMWSWDAAGARGAGGATDSYPSGTFSLGAEY